MNRGAQVAVQFIRRERAVVLVQGEAQFTVAKNPDRPFIVTAGNIKVRAVGTAFNVRVAAQAVEVFVTEGRVRLDSMSVPVAPAMGTEIDSGPTLPELLAGQRTVVSLAPHPPAPQVVLMSPEDIVRQLSWQPQLLDFSSTALGEVVSEFNRRNRLQLIVADPDLNALPIVASFRSDNVDGFVRLLEITADVRAERRGDREIVLHKGR